MQLEEALYNYLSTYSGLSTRIFPEILPQGITKPAIVYQRVSTNRIHTMRVDGSLVATMFQFTVWDVTMSGAKTVATYLRNALQNKTGLIGGVSGVTINAVLIENEFNTFDSETLEFGVVLEFEIFYYE